MSVIDEFLANNEAYAGEFTKGSLPMLSLPFIGPA